MARVIDILRKSPQERLDLYRARGIEKVIIDGNEFGGNYLDGFGTFSFLWEKSYVKEPVRSGDGSIGNLNSYATFLTPHLKINFSLMSIDTYRELMKLIYSRNEHTVTCYDVVFGETTTNKMYFTTEEMPKLWTMVEALNGDENAVELLGVQDYTVEMVGTNSELDLVNVTYHLNPPTDTGISDKTIGEENVYKGEELVIGQASNFQNETFGGKYKFTKWSIYEVGKDNGNYMDGYSYTINNDLVLYAQWETTTEHTLTFNYGLSDPVINETSYTYETSRKVVKDKSIGYLPVADIPKVKHKDLNGNEKEYTPYYNGNWYNTPIKAKNSEVITNYMPYWSERDSTIYLLYDVIKYDLTLYIDGSLYQTNSIEYNTPMNLPYLVRSGYTLDGWYTTSDFEDGTKASGNMPPYSISLYAKWEKSE